MIRKIIKKEGGGIKSNTVKQIKRHLIKNHQKIDSKPQNTQNNMYMYIIVTFRSTPILLYKPPSGPEPKHLNFILAPRSL